MPMFMTLLTALLPAPRSPLFQPIRSRRRNFDARAARHVQVRQEPRLHQETDADVVLRLVVAGADGGDQRLADSAHIKRLADVARIAQVDRSARRTDPLG